MQMGRLFEIVYLLLEKRTMTAAELAERFEVSVRTIYRDIEQLSLAGIPIYANKGRNGGIRLLEDYVLNKSVLTQQERSEILWALQGVSAVKGMDSRGALAKLNTLFGAGDSNWIEVDFSSWGMSNQETFEMIKRAVTEKLVIGMDYCNSAGKKTYRQIEPLQLYFKDKSWYVRAYCLASQGYRMFRITRMRRVHLVDQRSLHVFDEKDWTEHGEGRGYGTVCVRLKIDRSQSYRVYDDFSDDCLEQQSDGSFIAELICPEDEWVYGYILSYGTMAEVISPTHVREGIEARLRKMSEVYFNMT